MTSLMLFLSFSLGLILPLVRCFPFHLHLLGAYLLRCSFLSAAQSFTFSTRSAISTISVAERWCDENIWASLWDNNVMKEKLSHECTCE